MSSEKNLRGTDQPKETNKLVAEKDKNKYGSIQKQGTPHSDDSTSDHSSSSSTSSESSDEFGSSSKIAKRKKKRLRKHHFHEKSRPKLRSTLSHLAASAHQSEDENNEDDDIIDMPSEGFVFPELDRTASEVEGCLPKTQSEEDAKSIYNKINFSNIREKYRQNRFKERIGDRTIKRTERIKNIFRYSIYVEAVKKLLFANQTIVAFVYTDLFVDLLFCFAYLVEMKQEADIHAEPPWMYKWRSYNLWFLCVLLSLWNFCSFVIRMFLTGKPISVLLSFRSFIECTTTYPFIASIYMRHGQYLYVPYFLRSWVLLLRIKSVSKIKINLLMTDKAIDPLKTKLVFLIATIIVLLYNGMSAFQYCESTFGDVHYSILDSLYVVMVTLSTVGYGDITPHTDGSRVVMMLLIVISLAALPSLLADVLNTVRKKNDWGGSVPESAMPFILIVGSFRPEQVKEILDGFLNRETTEAHLNVIFLDINRPNEDLKFLERNSMWGHRIQFIHGSVMDEESLKRVRARDAKAIFTLSDQHTSDQIKEDERNTVRLWSLYCFTVSHQVPIYTYNLSPSTAIYQKMAEEIICVREFKQDLLALNCRCRGASTLLTNLLHQRQPLNHYDESWQAQYDDGSCNEIYMAHPPQALIGLTFKEAAWIVFLECQVILFAIKAGFGDKREKEILLNPDNEYVINRDDKCVYICEGPRDVEDVNSLNDVYVSDRLRELKHRREVENGVTVLSQASSSTKSETSCLLEVREARLRTTSAPASPMYHATNNSSRAPSPIASMTRSISSQSSKSHHFRLARLPSTRMAHLTGSRKLISRLGQSALLEPSDTDIESAPVCYLLDEPEQLENLKITDTEDMKNHIVVCVHHEITNIFKFVYNLRSPLLKPHELQDIVFLCAKWPRRRTYKLINRFPKVYFMKGNCQQPEDLLRAGIRRAKQVVVMSERECLDQYQRTSDSPAIMTSHLLDLLLSSKPTDSSRIVNLMEKTNIRFLHLLQGKDVAEEIDIFYTPAYASGNVVVDGLLSNVLLSQTYYKSEIVLVIKALCGMPGLLYDKHAAQNLIRSKPKPRLFDNFKNLSLIDMPDDMVGKSFAIVFETFLLDKGALTLGIYRAPDEDMGNELSFVYTNPVPSLVMRKSDKVYVLAAQGWTY